MAFGCFDFLVSVADDETSGFVESFAGVALEQPTRRKATATNIAIMAANEKVRCWVGVDMTVIFVLVSTP
ncbi:Uncharacterised protein [Arcanobacterium haemolyticum]|nr:Uncharacterised protein [Arcanobacterium haemolyticum]